MRPPMNELNLAWAHSLNASPCATCRLGILSSWVNMLGELCLVCSFCIRPSSYVLGAPFVYGYRTRRERFIFRSSGGICYFCRRRIMGDDWYVYSMGSGRLGSVYPSHLSCGV